LLIPQRRNRLVLVVKAAVPAQTHAANPDEVIAILDILQKAGEWKARAAAR
jgi:hypothetical protein